MTVITALAIFLLLTNFDNQICHGVLLTLGPSSPLRMTISHCQVLSFRGHCIVVTSREFDASKQVAVFGVVCYQHHAVFSAGCKRSVLTVDWGWT